MTKQHKIMIAVAATLLVSGTAFYLYQKAEKKKRVDRTVVTPAEASTIIADIAES